MQKNRTFILIVLLTLLGSAVQAEPLGTAFSYQGQLCENGKPVNGLYDLAFGLYADMYTIIDVGGPPIFTNGVPVTNGLFTVSLDFGPNAFNGNERWLQIAVRTNGPGGNVGLYPRQRLTPVPYALFASNAVNAATATTAQGVAQGQVVSSLNNLTDQVTLSGGANITLTPSGKDLQINVKSPFRVRGDGLGGSGGQIVFGALNLLGDDTYISEGAQNELYLVAPNGIGLGPGNVGIHVSDLSEATHGLTVKSSPQNDNVLRLIGRTGSFKYGAKLNFGDGDNAFLQEDNDDCLLVNARLGTRIMGGNVGIGTSDPQQKLHVVGLARFDLGGGSINISTPGGNPGLIAYAPNGHRRDIVMDDVGMRLLVGNSASPASVGIDIFEDGTTRVKVLQITGGADLAEPFETSEDKPVPKGAVMVIDDRNPGQLKMSDQPCDKRVAGVVSGAGGLNPGLTLSQQGLTDKGLPVALSGRVYTLADASRGPIRPGDLLTTSDTPGHAMKVMDHAEAQGAIIGKAMTNLAEGKGLVLVLVSLQ